MKNEDVEKIDSVLQNKHDLGFLLDYLENRKIAYNEPCWLSAVDVLRFIPEFNEEVKRIRIKYQIDPKQLNEDLSKLLGKSVYSKHLAKSQKFARGLYYPDLKTADAMRTVDKKIAAWEQKKFRTLSHEIGKLRIVKLGKLSGIWHEAIKNYILYNKITISLITYRKGFPKTKVCVDSDTLEPYIEIKVYSHTNIGSFKKRRWLEKMQKKLPNYSNPNKQITETFLNRFLYFVLKKHVGITHKDIQMWMKAKGLWGFEQNKSSREIRRLLERFIANPK